MLDNAKLKKKSLQQLKSRWQILFIACLTYGAVKFLLESTKNLLPDNGIISFLFNIFSLICTATLTFAVSKVSLDLTRTSEPLTFSNYTDSFTFFKPAVLSFFWVLLWLVIFALIIVFPSTFIYMLCFGMAIINTLDLSNLDFKNGFNFEHFESFSNPEEFFKTIFTQYLGLAILLIAIIFVLTAVLIYKLLQYSQIHYIIADTKNISVKKAMRVSIEYMKGHKGELFALYFSYIGWLILCFSPLFLTETLSHSLPATTVSLILKLITTVTFACLSTYIETACANFYNAVKEDAFIAGRVKAEDLQ